MPLAFESLNRGTVAFGFFNIETDLLLLQHYFFFAGDFCGHLLQMAENGDQETYETTWNVYSIEDSRNVGDLMAAIHGIRYTGFIGDVYRRFPFPEREAEFKQNPEGFQTRALVVSLLEKWAVPKSLPVRADKRNSAVSIGEYLFEKEVFYQLIHYVWVGGYPRWKNEARPEYVKEMKGALEKAGGWLSRGLVLR